MSEENESPVFKRRYKKKLQDYIYDSLKKGYPQDIIRQKLIETNVDKEVLDTLNFEKKKKPKFFLIFAPIVLFLLIASYFYFFQNTSDMDKESEIEYVPPDISAYDTVKLSEFPECLQMISEPLPRYSCYYSKASNDDSFYWCGYYFMYYDYSQGKFNGDLSEGEIILYLDGEPISRYINDYSGMQNISVYYEIMKTKKIGDKATIVTDESTYTHLYDISPVFPDTAYLPLKVGKGYCRKK